MNWRTQPVQNKKENEESEDTFNFMRKIGSNEDIDLLNEYLLSLQKTVQCELLLYWNDKIDTY